MVITNKTVLITGVTGRQGGTVICLVADQPIRELVDEAFDESVRAKGDLKRRSRRCVDGERKTSAVGPPP